MAQPTTSPFSKFIIQVGDGAAPEVFKAICGLTTKGLDITNNTSSTVVPDCANEDAPAYEETSTTSQVVSFSGSGVFAQEDALEMLQWALSGLSRNCRVYPSNAAAGDIDYFSGPVVLKTLGLAVNRGEKVTQNLDFTFALKPTVVLKV